MSHRVAVAGAVLMCLISCNWVVLAQAVHEQVNLFHLSSAGILNVTRSLIFSSLCQRHAWRSDFSVLAESHQKNFLDTLQR